MAEALTKKMLHEINGKLAQSLQSFEDRHSDILVPKGSIIWMQQGALNAEGQLHHLMVKEDTRCKHAIALDNTLCFSTSKNIKGAIKVTLLSALKFSNDPDLLDFLVKSEKEPHSTVHKVLTVPANQLAWRAIANGNSELSEILDDTHPVDLHLMTVFAVGKDPVALVGLGNPGLKALVSIRKALNDQTIVAKPVGTRTLKH